MRFASNPIIIVGLFFFFYYASVLYVETLVKFLMGAFPSVVAPQIEAWVALYCLFKHLEEAYCYLVFREFCWLVGHEAECADVFSSLRSLHIHIEYGIVHLPHNPLSAGEYRCVVV